MRRTTDRVEYVYEQLLVLRCQTGSEPAFAELVERYSPRLRAYLRRLLDDPDDAEDALQDVWTDVFRALPKLQQAGAFATWIYRIARDRAWRELRRRRPPGVPLEEVDPPGEDEEPEFGAEDAERIHQALGALSLEHREVLLLRFMEDMTPEQIARVTGCPPGTVRSRLHYARRALRREIERRFGHERA